MSDYLGAAEAVQIHLAEASRHIEALISLAKDADQERLGELLEARTDLDMAVGVLRADITSAALKLQYNEDNQVAAGDGAIERTWQSGRTHWDWPLITSAYAGYVARKFDVPEDLAHRIVADMTDTIGGTKSKAWRATELDKREILSPEMRETSGGKWTVKYVPPSEEPDDE